MTFVCSFIVHLPACILFDFVWLFSLFILPSLYTHDCPKPSFHPCCMKSEDSGGCRAWVVDGLLVALLAASAGVSVAVLVGLPGAALGYASSSERDDESGGGEPVGVARCRMEAVTLITTARFISSAHRSPREILDLTCRQTLSRPLVLCGHGVGVWCRRCYSVMNIAFLVCLSVRP